MIFFNKYFPLCLNLEIVAVLFLCIIHDLQEIQQFYILKPALFRYGQFSWEVFRLVSFCCEFGVCLLQGKLLSITSTLRSAFPNAMEAARPA